MQSKIEFIRKFWISSLKINAEYEDLKENKENKENNENNENTSSKNDEICDTETCRICLRSTPLSGLKDHSEDCLKLESIKQEIYNLT